MTPSQATRARARLAEVRRQIADLQAVEEQLEDMLAEHDAGELLDGVALAAQAGLLTEAGLEERIRVAMQQA